MARALRERGVEVFEHTPALSVSDGSPCRIRTPRGTLSARKVVVATHRPFLDRGLYFARMHPERSYSIAVSLKSAAPEGMYIAAGEPTRSLRSHPVDDGELLIVGGEGHKIGQGGDTREHYAALEAFAREHFDVGRRPLPLVLPGQHAGRRPAVRRAPVAAVSSSLRGHRLSQVGARPGGARRRAAA